LVLAKCIIDIAFCLNKAGREKAIGKINSKIFFELGQQRAFFEKPQKARGYWLKVKKMAVKTRAV
jgi:hypothetical protein